MMGSAGIGRLNLFLGTWEVKRRIIDRFNRSLVTFELDRHS